MPLPPGPRQPAVVQLLQFTFRPLPFLEECRARYGDPFTLRVAGLGTYVSLTAPEWIKEVFTGDSDVLHSGEANAMLEPVVGPNSVLLLDGPRHLRRRRLLLPPLHGERMSAYTALMAEITAAELERMPVGTPFSLHPHMQSITLKVILRAVFGLDEGAQMDELERLIVAFLEPPPAIATFLPVKVLDFPFSPYRTFMRRRKAVVAELLEIVRARRDAADPSRTDILSLLLSARDEEGQPMTEAELLDELMTMLLAGHETTATALSWAFACILQHPEVGQRLQAGSPEYLDAVIKESMRLRPILPDVVRKLKAPMKIAGYEIPAGVNLMPTIYLAHRNPQKYPEPEQFRPERFLGVKVDPYAWLPFGGGIRRCLGMAFALTEMKIVIAETLRRARFTLDSKQIRVVRRTITLAPSGGTRVVLRERLPASGLRPDARRTSPAADGPAPP